jgi:hypothetical protein
MKRSIILLCIFLNLTINGILAQNVSFKFKKANSNIYNLKSINISSTDSANFGDKRVSDLLIDRKSLNIYPTIEYQNSSFLIEKSKKLRIANEELLRKLGKERSEASRLSIVNSIKENEFAIERAEISADSLLQIYQSDRLLAKPAHILSFNTTRSNAFYNIIYNSQKGKFRLLSNSGFNFGDSTASIYTELASGTFYSFRVTLGSMITSSKLSKNADPAREEALQRLQSYGGNTVLNIEYPLCYVHTKNGSFNFISRFLSKGTVDLPAFGSTTTSFAGSAMAGLDFYADASLSNNSLRFYCNLGVNRAVGTKTFCSNLGIDKSAFGFGQLKLGVVLGETINLSFIVRTFSTEDKLSSRSVVLGGTLLH